jgi:hypothetical protein
MRVWALVLAACALALASGCEGDGDATATEPQAKTTTLDERNDLAQVKLTRCNLRGGGADVRVANISCDEVQRTLSQWIPLPVHSGNDPKEGLFVVSGWRCWGRLEKRYGPILNVCMRGDQFITYKFH